MGFKKTNPNQASAATPEALFHDLRSRRTVQGLLSQQADTLRAYAGASDKSDIALQLPTGSGKTLVGLLIAEWRRRQKRERAVFLCPTVQLVNQVVKQSLEYGIPTVAFTGSRRDYSATAKGDYETAETVAVTTYSSLFNTNPFFADAGVLILDDAHAAENFVADFWTVKILRSEDKATYLATTELLRPFLGPSDMARLAREQPDAWDARWVEAVPMPYIADNAAELITFFDAQLAKTNARYSWGIIRDHLEGCQILISMNEIIIRPTLPPTFSHSAFTTPNQRIYMSATLGIAGELERLWGREKIERLPVPSGWERHSVGRRLFFFPERSLDEQGTADLVTRMIREVPRALILTPDKKTATTLINTIGASVGGDIFQADDLEHSKESFIASNRAIAFLANRYDGVDLANDECRLLILYGLPRAVNLHETLLISRFGASIFLTDRILTRLVQATGRCTRAATDYSAVVVVGEDPTSFFLHREYRELLHPEMQAEIEFGMEQSKNVTSDDMLDNFQLFLGRSDEWIEAENDIVSLRDNATQKELPAAERLRLSASREVRCQNAMWRGSYSEALDEARNALSHLGGDDLKGYRAYWNYIAGSLALKIDPASATQQSTAADYFHRASSIVASVTWLPKLASTLARPEDNARSSTDGRIAQQVVTLERVLESYGTVNGRRFEAAVAKIQTDISSNESKPFESALVGLGKMLGFTAGNDESDAAPDPWWLIGAEHCIVFEAHTNVAAGANAVLGANKVRQAKSHPDWIRANVQVYQSAVVTPVIITPCRQMNAGAAPHVEGVFYWQMDELRSWAAKALSVVRELWRTLRVGDLEWRAMATARLKQAELDVDSLDANLRSRPLSSLPLDKSDESMQ